MGIETASQSDRETERLRETQRARHTHGITRKTDRESTHMETPTHIIIPGPRSSGRSWARKERT
eukprot:1704485-Rhodomonas_salina.1